jgi:hypothetical protein
MTLRQQGQSLAQIAEARDVDPQVLIDALVARWEARIQVRVASGVLTDEAAATLRTQLETQARNMVFTTTLGGMHGAVVGAGPGSGAGAGAGAGMMGRGTGHGMGGGPGAGAGAGRMGQGTGTCTGLGPWGAGQP